MAALSIPAFHVSDISRVQGSGEIYIQSRDDAATTGTFRVDINVSFNPPLDEYPAGVITMKVDLNDGARGTFSASSIELVNSYGTANPTIFMTGRCRDDITPDAKGCRYWLMIVNNRNLTTGAVIPAATPDIVGFAIHDNMGNRVAYGCGPVRVGDFNVSPI